MFSKLKQLIHDTRGMAYLEFAIVIPFLLILFMGGVEVSRYILVHQKMDKATNTIADVVAQAPTLSQADVDQLLAAVNDLTDPYAFSTGGRVLISSVSPESGVPRVRWQYCGGGNLGATSHIGQPGNNAVLPASLSLGEKEDIIVAEVFYSFSPMLFEQMLPSGEIYKAAYYRPRLGALDDTNLHCSTGGDA